MQIYVPAPPVTPQTEDALIEGFFGRQYQGYFVDIEAFDGVAYSNSRPLWERGWKGMLIEPDPITFKRLLENYPNKDRLEFINSAVCQKNGPVSFTQHSDKERAGWHSLDSEWISTWEPGKAKKIVVNGVRFDSLRFATEIDLLSIDTEGYDVAIIESIPESIRPRLIIAEVDKHRVRQRLEKEMERRNYKFIWGTYLNSAYAAS